jgi:hypothetical protein
MVVPVPVVLQEENVKTLPRDIFDRLDKLSAPRLVEYWEQDPCAPIPPPRVRVMAASVAGRAPPAGGAPGCNLGVTIEATSFVKTGAFLDPGFLASATSVPVTILASPSPDPAPADAADAGAPDAGSPDAGSASPPSPPPPVPPESGGCAGCEVGRGAGSASLAFAAALAAVGLFAGRRKSS